MSILVRKVLRAVGGVLICIAIWTVQDRLRGDAGSQSADAIPAEVWGGGSSVVTIEAESSEPGFVSASFDNNRPIDDARHEYLDTWQKIDAGPHTFHISVPADVSGSVWLRIDKPKVGATIKLAVKVDGKLVSEDFDRLEAPLEAGYGFSIGIELDDYAGGKLAEDW
jgi:hypothetical protein